MPCLAGSRFHGRSGRQAKSTTPRGPAAVSTPWVRATARTKPDPRGGDGGPELRVGAVDLVPGNPGTRHASGQRGLDERGGQDWFGREAHIVGDTGRGTPERVVGPTCGVVGSRQPLRSLPIRQFIGARVVTGAGGHPRLTRQSAAIACRRMRHQHPQALPRRRRPLRQTRVRYAATISVAIIDRWLKRLS